MSTKALHSRGSQLLKNWRGDAQQVEACKLLCIDTATYNRFEHGVRKPSAELSFKIERLTDGAVYARSWYEPPRLEKSKVSRRRAA